MASTKIRGITVEIGGDTSGLQASLKNVNRDLDRTQDQLRDVNKLLKLDPSNVDLLKQKQDLLAKAVEQGTKKLEELKKAQLAFIENGGDVNGDGYKALEREVISTKLNIDRAKKGLEEFNETAEEGTRSVSDLGEAAGSLADKTAGISKAAQGALAAMAGGIALSVKEFASYEQSLGGIETFFKDSAGIVQQYADEAYKSAGLSANKYMETVTGFSAALLSSLGGNTRAAAELANIAIVDMSDNANKFGTDIESIQSAYQGFAKQNYNMLDNLKLGFAGNKQGMEELLAEAERLTGVKFDINNFSDIVMAIHEVQQSMGVAGTTAKEAETTISGSIATLKASISDLALGFARTDADVEQLTDNTMAAFQQVLENIAPVIERILNSVPGWAKLAAGVVAVVAVLSPIASLAASITTIMGGLTASTTAAAAGFTGLSLATAGYVAIALALAAAIGAIAAAFDDLAKKHIEQGNGDWLWQDPMYNGVPYMANGGVLSSGSAVVGEAGAELLTMSNGKAIVQPLTNNYTTNNYNTQAAGGYQPVDVTLLLDSATLARVMVQPNARAATLAGESAIY